MTGLKKSILFSCKLGIHFAFEKYIRESHSPIRLPAVAQSDLLALPKVVNRIRPFAQGRVLFPAHLSDHVPLARGTPTGSVETARTSPDPVGFI